MQTTGTWQPLCSSPNCIGTNRWAAPKKIVDKKHVGVAAFVIDGLRGSVPLRLCAGASNRYSQSSAIYTGQGRQSWYFIHSHRAEFDRIRFTSFLPLTGRSVCTEHVARAVCGVASRLFLLSIGLSCHLHTVEPLSVHRLFAAIIAGDQCITFSHATCQLFVAECADWT